MEKGRIILVTGGSRSGKSTFGEELLKDRDDVLYIATAKNIDGEMDERIRKHRERRNSKWKTLEAYRGLSEKTENYSERYILLDCITNLISNITFDEAEDMDNITYEEGERVLEVIRKELTDLLSKVRETDRTLIMITNEVGMGLISEYRLGRIFTDHAGFMNQMLSKNSDEVYFMVSGIPMRIK